MNRRGQSMIEYALIAVLVILGIVVMGPYVLRSVGAHFKLWDTGVQDSFTETLNQAPVNDVPFINGTCSCTQTVGSCGQTGTDSLCAANAREIDFSCNPQGCNGANQQSYCNPNPIPGQPNCCTGWVNTGVCGTYPLPTDSSGKVDITQETTNQNPPKPPAIDNCYYGQMIQRQQCATTPAIQCIPDPQTSQNPNGCAMPTCTGIFLPGSALPCSQPTAANPLSTDNHMFYVASGNCPANPSSLPNCYMYCDEANQFFLNPQFGRCERQFQVALPPGGDYSICTARCVTTSTGTADNFQICAGSNEIITAASTKAVPPTVSPTIKPLVGDGCQNYGEPGQECQINAAY